MCFYVCFNDSLNIENYKNMVKNLNQQKQQVEISIHQSPDATKSDTDDSNHGTLIRPTDKPPHSTDESVHLVDDDVMEEEPEDGPGGHEAETSVKIPAIPYEPSKQELEEH